MRLSTRGQPVNITKPVVGRIATTTRTDRAESLLLADLRGIPPGGLVGLSRPLDDGAPRPGRAAEYGGADGPFRPFGRPSERVSAWPNDVWAYLNSAPPDGVRRETRLESLIEDWTRQGRISSQASPAAERKVEFLTSSFSERRRLSLNDLSDRSSMLADLRAQVALMKRDLAELARYLRGAGW